LILAAASWLVPNACIEVKKKFIYIYIYTEMRCIASYEELQLMELFWTCHCHFNVCCCFFNSINKWGSIANYLPVENKETLVATSLKRIKT